MILTLFSPGSRFVRAPRLHKLALFVAACAIVLGTISVSATLADEPPRNKGFFGLDTGGGNTGPTPEQIAALNKRLGAVMKLVGEGKYTEADAALKQLKEDATGSGIKSDGIDNLERIIRQRLTEQRDAEARSGGGNQPSRPTAPIPGKTRPKPPAPKDPFATKKQLDRLLEMDDAAKASAGLKPGELTDKQAAVAKEISRLVRFGRSREAAPLLRQLRSAVQTRSAPRHAIVEGLMAEIANAQKRYQMAMNLAGPFVDKRDEYHRAKFNCYLQVAYAHLGLEAPKPAAELFNWIALMENDGNTLNQILAIEGVGRVHLYNEQLARAENAFGFALHNLKAMLDKHEYADYLSDDELAFIELLRTRLKAQLDQVKHLRFLERVGPIFIMYRDAQRLRLNKKDYLGALQKYDALIAEYPDSTYAEASRLYKGLCMIEVGGYESGEKHLLKFIEDDEAGLYRGEALLQLGRLSLLRKLDDQKAATTFERLRLWIQSVRRESNPRLTDVLPGALREIAPPRQEKAIGFWKNVHPVALSPEHLLNRSTATWYLDNIEESCEKFLGFLAIHRGDADQAKAHFHRVLKLDPQTRAMATKGIFNEYGRLMFAADHGYIVAHPEDRKLFGRKQQFVISVADFFYITEQYSDAIELYGRLLKNEFGLLSSAQRDYPNYVLGQIKFRAGQVEGRSRLDEAIAHHKKVLSHVDGTWSEFRSGYSLATIARRSPDVATVRDGWRVLNILARNRSDNIFVHKARIRLGLDLIDLGRDQEGIAALKTVPKTSPEYGWARWLIKNYR